MATQYATAAAFPRCSILPQRGYTMTRRVLKMSQNVSKLLLAQLDIGNRSSALVNNFSGIEISTNGLLFTDCRQTRRR